MNNKKRVRWTTSVDPDLLEQLRKLSIESRISVSKYADEAIEYILSKYANEDDEK